MGGVGCRLTERKMADEHVCECMRECVRVAQTRLSSLCVCVCIYTTFDIRVAVVVVVTCLRGAKEQALQR